MSLRSLTILLILLLACSAGLVAQQDRGTFVGTVMDSTGAVVPGVDVTVVNTQTNARWDSSTNVVGQYRVPNLPIGVYRITFEATGFKTIVRDNLRLSVTDVIRIDANLEVGSAAESVTVSAEVSLLNTETPEVGTLMDSRTVLDLPLGFSGGRNLENFAYKLTPGVGGNSWESRINGSPAFAKEVLLDGGSASVYIGGHFSESAPSMEAIEEFKVQTSGMSAEFARTGGGVFNFVMKSGTNQVRGSAMGQIHNEWMDANTFANNAFGRPRLYDRRHNYAVSAGGPMYIPKVLDGRDKWFFYAAYERYRHTYAGGGSPTVTVPLPEWWDGDMSRYLTNETLGQDALGRPVVRGQIFDPASTRVVNGQMVRDAFPGNIIPASRISPVSRNLADIFRQHYMPQIRQADGQFAMINNSFFPVSNTGNYQLDLFSVKSDYYISSMHKLSGTFSRYDRPRELFDQGGVWDFNAPNGGPLSRARVQPVATHLVRLAYDWTVSPTILNHMLVAGNRQINPSVSLHVNEPGAQILGISGIRQDMNFPEMNFGGGDRVNFPTAGYQSNDLLAGTAYQLVDTLSWVKGSHTLKFGFDYRFNGLAARDSRGPGAFNFGANVTGLLGFPQVGHAFASMLLGEVSGANVYIDTPVGSQYNMYSLFFQDDWKVSRRLTLNLGLRWDYQPPGTEHYDRLHSFMPDLVDPATGIRGVTVYAGEGPGRTGERRFFPGSKRHFSPRIGLAYQASEKMTFRSGYGIFFHGRIPNGWSGVPWGAKYGFQYFNQINPVQEAVPTFNWGNGYQGIITEPKLDPKLAEYQWGVVTWDNAVGRVGYTQQWNANIQYEVARDLVVDVGYVGSQSTGIMANEISRPNQMNYNALQLGDTLGQWIDRQSAIPAAAAALGARYPFSEPGTWMPISQTLQPFPQIPNWSTLLAWGAPLGFNTYNALQVQVNKRYSRGIWLTGNYTFAKTMDNVNSAFGDTWGMNSGRPLDFYNLGLEKTISQFDQTHVFKVGASYDVPFGRSRSFGRTMNPVLDAVAGGWTIQFIGNYASGFPMGFGATGTPNFNAVTNRAVIMNPDGRALKLDSFSKSNFDMSSVSVPGTTAHRYFDTSLVRDPVRYERGNASRLISQLRQPWFFSDDFSLQKNFYFKGERIRTQLRMEALNLFNRNRFSGFNTHPANPLFGQVTAVSNDRRQIQFGIRADF
jgi:hypothetical protein